MKVFFALLVSVLLVGCGEEAASSSDSDSDSASGTTAAPSDDAQTAPETLPVVRYYVIADT